MTSKVDRRNYVKYAGAGIVVIAVAGAGTYYATRPTTPKEVEIDQQWLTGPEGDWAKKLAIQWNEDHTEKTGIAVNTTSLSFLGYFDKVAAQMVSDDPKPDLIEIWSYYTGMYAPYLEPLNDYFEDPELFSSPDGEPYNFTDMDSVCIDAGSFEGKIYNLWDSNLHITSMRLKDIIPTPIQTWEECIEVARQNTKSLNPDSKTKYGMCLPGRPEVGYTWKGWVSCYWSYGGQYFKPGTFEPDFNSEAGLKAAEIWYTAAKEKLMPPDVPAWAFMEVMAAMQTGEVAWTFNWQLIYPTLENPDESPLVYDRVAHDGPPGAVQPDGTILKAPYRGGNVVGLRKTSQHKKEAFKYLAWHMWGDGMWSAVEQGSTPGNLSPYNDPEAVAKYPWIADFVRMNLHVEGRPEPAYPELPTIQAQGCAAVNSLLSLQITPEDFVERIQKEAVAVLKEAGTI